MATAGISTLGIKFGYATSTGGSKPSKFKQLTRINAIGGISLETEQIDASALEDFITRYIAGRADTGGTFPVTVNLTSETITEWKAVIEAYNALGETGEMWFETWSPYLTDGFFVVAQPPSAIPQPDTDQNGLWTVEMNLTINEYKGLDTGIEPTEE